MKLFNKKSLNQPIWFVAAAVSLIVVTMPIHGFFSTFVGYLTGVELLAKAWKEVLLSVVGVAVLVDAFSHQDLARKLLRDKISQVILAYAGLHILIYFIKQPDADATVVGMLLNLRFLVFFAAARWLSLRLPKERASKQVLNLFMAIMIGVSVFALLQFLILPDTFLEMFGYGEEGAIDATYTLDGNDDLVRVASTTRGPNALGALLALPLAFLTVNILNKKRDKQKVKDALITLLMLGALFLTFSRSGWLASAIAIAVTIFMTLDKRSKEIFALGTLLIVGVGTAILLIFTNSSSILKTLILHDDPNTGRKTSTTQRFEANADAFEQIMDNPIGEGPGTAGPASFYSDKGERIAENYYLQIGQEIGLAGIVVFMTIIFLIAKKLYLQKEEHLPRILFASLVGLSIAAMFTHTWADEEIAFVWWGLAGLAVNNK